MGAFNEDVAWAAGLFCGEGSTCVLRPKGKSCHRLSVRIGQSDPEVLHRFKSVVLGAGNVTGPYQRSGRPGSDWAWSSMKFEDCQAVIAMIWKHMSTSKKQQAMAALRIVRQYQSQRLTKKEAF